MENDNRLFKYIGNSKAVNRLEDEYEFRAQEDSLLKTLDYLESRYTVIKAYDHITSPTPKYDTDMLFKISTDYREIMWVYFQYAPRSKYISVEVDNDTVVGIKPQLSGFVRARVRSTPGYPSLKLVFNNYALIKQSLADICDCLDNHGQGGSSNDSGINFPMTLKGIIHKSDGTIQCLCGRCGMSFTKAERCPECGQLVRFNGGPNKSSVKRILHVGDNVSNMKIYEIINKYFGESYDGWMKASYEINNRYWAWFPTITKTIERPNGTYGGTAMWSNVVSDDKRTVISTNHDEPNKLYEAPDKYVLIFARINWHFEFLGVFNDYQDPDAEYLTYRHDRVAQGIDLDTFQLVDED